MKNYFYALLLSIPIFFLGSSASALTLDLSDYGYPNATLENSYNYTSGSFSQTTYVSEEPDFVVLETEIDTYLLVFTNYYERVRVSGGSTSTTVRTSDKVWFINSNVGNDYSLSTNLTNSKYFVIAFTLSDFWTLDSVSYFYNYNPVLYNDGFNEYTFTVGSMPIYFHDGNDSPDLNNIVFTPNYTFTPNPLGGLSEVFISLSTTLFGCISDLLSLIITNTVLLLPFSMVLIFVGVSLFKKLF